MALEKDTSELAVLEERVKQHELRICDRFTAEKFIREKLETQMNLRLESMNEFRHQLDRQSATFVTRNELLTVSSIIAAITVGVVEIAIKLMK